MNETNTSTLIKEFNIVLVEDSHSYRLLLTKYLKNKAKLYSSHIINIHSFSNSKDCLKQISQIEPDIAILDYNLDETTPTNYSDELTIENGYDLMLAVKDLLPRTKIVFLSDQTNIHVAANIFHNGADGYIPKQPGGAGRTFDFITKIISDILIDESNKALGR